MYVPYRSVRKSHSKINFEVRFLSDSLGGRFDIPTPIFGENTIPEGLQRHRAFFRIEPKEAVYFGRPIRPLSTVHIPGPTARTIQMLGFGQIALAASQLPFRFPCNRSIRHRPNELDAARGISRSMSHGMNIFHRTIRHQQSIFMVEILSLAGRAIDRQAHGRAIFRMGALDNKFYGRLRCSVALKDSEGFVRPDNFSASVKYISLRSSAASIRF